MLNCFRYVLLVLVLLGCSAIGSKPEESVKAEPKIIPSTQGNYSDWQKLQGPELASEKYKCDKRNSIQGDDLAMPLCTEFQINHYLIYLLSSVASQKRPF